MDKDLLAEYGKACVELEIAQNRHSLIKQKVADALKKDQEPKEEPNKE